MSRSHHSDARSVCEYINACFPTFYSFLIILRPVMESTRLDEVDALDDRILSLSELCRGVFEPGFRFLALNFSLYAIFALVICRSTGRPCENNFDACVTFSPSFQLLLYANVLVPVYSLLTILVNTTPCCTTRAGYYCLLLLDMVIMVVMISTSAVATKIYHVSIYGNDKIGRRPVSDDLGAFYKTVVWAALILSYSTFLCFVVISIFSAHKLRKIEASPPPAEIPERGEA